MNWLFICLRTRQAPLSFKILELVFSIHSIGRGTVKGLNNRFGARYGNNLACYVNYFVVVVVVRRCVAGWLVGWLCCVGWLID